MTVYKGLNHGYLTHSYASGKFLFNYKGIQEFDVFVVDSSLKIKELL
jgi:hypothetical protein